MIDGLNGFANGNSIEIKVWKNELNEEVNLATELIEGEMIFNNTASVFVTINNQITKVNDEYNTLKISVFPNPASENVTISFSALPEAGTRITLLDVVGKSIMNRIVQNTNEILNISDLPSGLYFVKTEINNNYHIQKLIKR